MGQRHAEPGAQQPVQRAEAQPANRQYLSGQPGPVKLKRQLGARPCGALRAQQADPFGLEPTQREPHGRPGRRVQPLDVVDDHQDRRRHCEHQQRGPERRRDHPRFRRHRRRVLDQQRRAERPPLRRRKLGQDRIQPRAEQVGKTREGQPHVASRRHRPQHRVPQAGGLLQPRPQQRGLPRPGRPGQHQRRRCPETARRGTRQARPARPHGRIRPAAWQQDTRAPLNHHWPAWRRGRSKRVVFRVHTLPGAPIASRVRDPAPRPGIRSSQARGEEPPC